MHSSALRLSLMFGSNIRIFLKELIVGALYQHFFGQHAWFHVLSKSQR
jgi:hypothetical protein